MIPCFSCVNFGSEILNDISFSVNLIKLAIWLNLNISIWIWKNAGIKTKKYLNCTLMAQKIFLRSNINFNKKILFLEKKTSRSFLNIIFQSIVHTIGYNNLCVYTFERIWMIISSAQQSLDQWIKVFGFWYTL